LVKSNPASENFTDAIKFLGRSSTSMLGQKPNFRN
jgi:hypothetical protein